MEIQKLSIKGCSLASGILWAGAVFFVGVLNLISPTYGLSFIWLISSVYPGYRGEATIVSILIATAYALVDGLIGGALFAWLYNFGAKLGKK